MRVIVKHPGMEPEVTEVEGIQDINKLVGNVDVDGNGWNHVGSDERQAIAPGVDEYMKSDAAINPELERNLWHGNTTLYGGTIVFAGYDKEKKADYGACSLTDEQIKMCIEYIYMQMA